MTQVHRLKSITEMDKESSISVLEEALEEAKNGRVQHVAISIVRPGNELESKWSEGDAAATLGALSILQYRILQSLDE